MLTAYGKFIKKDKNVFRTEAYLQWGDSDEILGIVLMLNPGKADSKEEIINENKWVETEVKLDSTMKALKNIVEEMYSAKGPRGRIYIYNLFTLRNPKSIQALVDFQQLYNKEQELLCGFPKARELLLSEMKKASWILVGWGCGKDNQQLKQVKNRWMKLIKDSGTTVLGIKGKDECKWYHPNPQIQHGVVEYRKEILKQYQMTFTEEYIRSGTDKEEKKNVKKYSPSLCIKVNGQVVNEIPHIEFDMAQDILISNGNFIVADYIDEYCDSIGIYRNEDTSITVVFFLETHTTINIEISYGKDGSKVCIIEHQYNIEKMDY